MFFDNAKILAIVLVAMGHAWEPLKGDSRILEGAQRPRRVTRPAFILISGYFSRSFDMRPDRLKRLITGVAVPYIIFETAYPLFKRCIFDHGAGHQSSAPVTWASPGRAVHLAADHPHLDTGGCGRCRSRSASRRRRRRRDR
ncbi:hypothetical protein SPURM210S_05612 [Streptomyces purpurascens]